LLSANICSPTATVQDDPAHTGATKRAKMTSGTGRNAAAVHEATAQAVSATAARAQEGGAALPDCGVVSKARAGVDDARDAMVITREHDADAATATTPAPVTFIFSPAEHGRGPELAGTQHAR